MGKDNQSRGSVSSLRSAELLQKSNTHVKVKAKLSKISGISMTLAFRYHYKDLPILDDEIDQNICTNLFNKLKLYKIKKIIKMKNKVPILERKRSEDPLAI